MKAGHEDATDRALDDDSLDVHDAVEGAYPGAEHEESGNDHDGMIRCRQGEQ
jgi:hypothetical protein